MFTLREYRHIDCAAPMACCGWFISAQFMPPVRQRFTIRKKGFRLSSETLFVELRGFPYLGVIPPF
jgi:hypothetical protein